MPTCDLTCHTLCAAFGRTGLTVLAWAVEDSDSMNRECLGLTGLQPQLPAEWDFILLLSLSLFWGIEDGSEDGAAADFQAKPSDGSTLFKMEGARPWLIYLALQAKRDWHILGIFSLLTGHKDVWPRIHRDSPSLVDAPYLWYKK